MKHLNIIKGIIIGVAKIIPGLSGAVLMISFNLYDKAISALTNFFDNKEKNFLFLSELGIGILIGIVLFSKIISFFLEKYFFLTTIFFIGLILGGITTITKEFNKTKQNIIITIITFLIVVSLSITKINTTYTTTNTIKDSTIFFISGLLEAIGTIIPGISSTALLMLIGIYKKYITTISNILNISLLKENLSFIIPFSLGLLIGIITISLLINYLFQKHKEKTFAIILGFSFSSIFILIIKLIPYINNITNILIGILLLLIGYLITNKL